MCVYAHAKSNIDNLLLHNNNNNNNNNKMIIIITIIIINNINNNNTSAASKKVLGLNGSGRSPSQLTLKKALKDLTAVESQLSSKHKQHTQHSHSLSLSEILAQHAHSVTVPGMKSLFNVNFSFTYVLIVNNINTNQPTHMDITSIN